MVRASDDPTESVTSLARKELDERSKYIQFTYDVIFKVTGWSFLALGAAWAIVTGLLVEGTGDSRLRVILDGALRIDERLVLCGAFAGLALIAACVYLYLRAQRAIVDVQRSFMCELRRVVLRPEQIKHDLEFERGGKDQITRLRMALPLSVFAGLSWSSVLFLASGIADPSGDPATKALGLSVVATVLLTFGLGLYGDHFEERVFLRLESRPRWWEKFDPGPPTDGPTGATEEPRREVE